MCVVCRLNVRKDVHFICMNMHESLCDYSAYNLRSFLFLHKLDVKLYNIYVLS